jgi:hypothetical protein
LQGEEGSDSDGWDDEELELRAQMMEGMDSPFSAMVGPAPLLREMVGFTSVSNDIIEGRNVVLYAVA